MYIYDFKRFYTYKLISFYVKVFFFIFQLINCDLYNLQFDIINSVFCCCCLFLLFEFLLCYLDLKY